MSSETELISFFRVESKLIRSLWNNFGILSSRLNVVCYNDNNTRGEISYGSCNTLMIIDEAHPSASTLLPFEAWETSPHTGSVS
jgi:hypothetical protein